jgi:chromate transporter
MRRDLVQDRKLIDEPSYNLSIALAQIMPGPLAAQMAMAIGTSRAASWGQHSSAWRSFSRRFSWFLA